MKTNKKPTKKVRPSLAAETVAANTAQKAQQDCSKLPLCGLNVVPPPPQPRLVVLAEKIVDIQRNREYLFERRESKQRDLDETVNIINDINSRLKDLDIKQLEHQNELDRFASLK